MSAQRKANLERQGLRSGFDIPVRVGGKLVAILTLRRYHEPRVWQDAEIALGSALGNLACLVLERERRRQAEALMSDTAAKLEWHQQLLNKLMHHPDVRSGSLTAAMRVLTEALCVELDTDRVALNLLNSERDDVAHTEAYERVSGSHVPVVFEQGKALVGRITSSRTMRLSSSRTRRPRPKSPKTARGCASS